MSKSEFRTLRDLLEASGVPKDEIDRAEADGTLGLLAIDQMILADQSPEVHAGRARRRRADWARTRPASGGRSA